MATVAFDDFERADNTDLGANWTPLFAANGGDRFGIVSGVAKPPTTGGNDRGEVHGTTLAADHWGECLINSAGTGGAGSGCGPCVRASAPGGSFSYYRHVGNGGGWEVSEWGGGGFVGSLGSGGGTTFTAGDTVYLEFQGSTWKAKKGTSSGAGGTQIATGSDSTLNANTRAGITYSTDDGSNSGIRSFVMGDFTGGTQSFSYTAVGGLSLAGAAAELRKAAPAAAGGVTLSGTAALVRKITRAAAGGIALGGAAAFAKGQTVTPAGGLSLAGAAAPNRIRVAAPAGGLVLSGDAGYATSGAQQFSYTAQGGISLGGSAAQTRAVARVAAGGLLLGGAAAISAHEQQRVVAAAGGLQIGGAASVSTFDSGAKFGDYPSRRRRR